MSVKFSHWANNLVKSVGDIGADLGDNADVRSKKRLHMFFTVGFVVAGLLWGLSYFIVGEPLAGIIPAGYGVVSLLSLILFRYTKNYPVFQFSQLLFILLLPFLLMLAFGGFINSSAVIIWSLLSPLAALVLSSARAALIWFLSFVSLVVISGFLQPFTRVSNSLSPLLITMFFVMNIGAVSSLAFGMLYYFIMRLHEERAKSENLLLNVLPKEIAAILRDDSHTIAEHFDSVTILFADVANFTPMSAKMTATEVVDMLNSLFSHFDTLAEKYGLEKIKTIGDCYMVAAGVPMARPDHAQAVARMALEMVDYVNAQTRNSSKPLDLRIGIHSGPVVAGVIGRKKFIYDLWGDSVNTASRMESHGTPGKIQITAETYALLRNDFMCEPRGMVNVKGKGEMETWYLVGVNKQ